MAYNNTIGLIDAQYIRDNSTLFANIEDKFIEPSIIRVQNSYLQDVLTTTLYNLIISSYDAYLNSGTPLPSRIESLVDNYLIPIILHYTIYDLLPDFYGKITAQGLLRSKGTENGDPFTMEDLNKFMKVYEDRAQVYSQMAIKYIMNNPTLYPEYFELTIEDDPTIGAKVYRGFYIGGLPHKKINYPYGGCGCDE